MSVIRDNISSVFQWSRINTDTLPTAKFNFWHQNVARQSEVHLTVSMTSIAKPAHALGLLLSSAWPSTRWHVAKRCFQEKAVESASRLQLWVYIWPTAMSPSAVPRQTRGIAAGGRVEEGDQKQDTQEKSRQIQSSSAGLRSSWLVGCLTRQGLVSMPRMRRVAASTHSVWPSNGEVTLTDCSKCQGSRRQEGNWTWVKEHGSLQREKEAWAVATELVYNLCFLVCEWQEGRRCLRQGDPACTEYLV